MVEHALCPLDRNSSLNGDRFKESSYRYNNSSGQRCTASVRVDYPLGLTASDEFYLWGLLALTVSQPEKNNELHATPHYCLRQLGFVGAKGGRNYALFREAIHRLSAVSYQNDGFYDPVRREHRDVAFQFLSYSLPIDPASCRAWRLVWNPIFFEMSTATGATLMFDLETYRDLDEASRRLFLLLKKVFWRRRESPRFDVRELTTHTLGFSVAMPQRRLNERLRRCIRQLAVRGIVDEDQCQLIKQNKGVYSIKFRRGDYFGKRTESTPVSRNCSSALMDLLKLIGFDVASTQRLLNRYPHSILREWADITLAARERFGGTFFKVSPQAYFTDNVRSVVAGSRTPPDWWHEIRRAEQRKVRDEHRAARESNSGGQKELTGQELAAFNVVVEQLFQQFRASGQSEMAALKNAKHHARQHVQGSSHRSAVSLRAIRPIP